MGVFKKPLVAEKVSALNENGFIAVDLNATKAEIKKAVEDMYGVTVEDVNTMRYQGKSKARYTSARIVKGRAASF